MDGKIRITILTDTQEVQVVEQAGISVQELAKKHYDDSDGFFPVFAMVNDRGQDMLYRITRPSVVRFMDLRNRLARLTYQRSLYFLYLAARSEVDPDAVSILKHPLNDGIYIKVENCGGNFAEMAWRTEKRIREMVREDVMFTREILRRRTILSKEPPEILTQQQIEFIRKSDVREVFQYTCGGFSAVFYDPLVRSAGCLHLFEIVPYEKGIIIRTPQYQSPNKLSPYRDDRKIYEAFMEEMEWKNHAGVWYISDLNEKVRNNEWQDLVLLNEALQEKRIAAIADEIADSGKRIVLITGPSSSGKTTFAQRLCIQLRVNGRHPLYIGTDDYFVERDQAPRDEFGEYDFENLDAVDVALFNRQLNDLLAGKEVDMPVFDFISGSKRYGTRITCATEDQIFIIEGIHALNDALTNRIDENEKFRIYISPLTTLNIDNNNRIPVTDLRLVRRIARDIRSRGRTASETLAEWKKVRAGETKNIFPYTGRIDAFFNSSFLCEWAMLKPVVREHLEEIREEDENYIEAERLLRILRCVRSLYRTDDIVSNSIMREFLNGGIWVK